MILRQNVDFSWLVKSRLSDRATQHSSDVLHNEFRFLNASRTLPDPIDWRLACWPEAPPLWRFHLHYHEFLLALMASGRRTADGKVSDRAWQIVEQWIERNAPTDGAALSDAWHPFCISRRLPVWIALWTAAPPDGRLAQTVLDSVYCQARYLAHHLERDLGGNHLLENLRALIMVAGFLDVPEADRWLSVGSAMFRQELTEQILPHGEHFERSPMYHAHMLEAVLDVRDASTAWAPDLSAACRTVGGRMAEFLQTILHPDGEIPLLGDAALGETPASERLIERAGRPNASTDFLQRAGDYWIARRATTSCCSTPATPDLTTCRPTPTQIC